VKYVIANFKIGHTKYFQQQQGVTEPAEERSRSPWTPSYSVTGVEPASALENQVVVNESEFVEHGSFITETQPIVRFYLVSHSIFAQNMVACRRGHSRSQTRASDACR
jgi:hypothetical protein